MIKLIVSDLDGTLLPYGESEISISVKRSISSIRERGIHFAVSSGRTYGELISYLPEFKDDIYFICCDGSYYVKGGKLLYEKRVEKDELSALGRAATKCDCMLLHGAFENYAVGSPLSGITLPSLSRVSNVKEAYEKDSIYKITLFGSKPRLGAPTALRLHWDSEHANVYQYVSRFANKGAALSNLQSRLILTSFDTAAIGDADNDISMMRGAKYSAAVVGRSEELASVCKFRFDSGEAALAYLSELSKMRKI